MLRFCVFLCLRFTMFPQPLHSLLLVNVFSLHYDHSFLPPKCPLFPIINLFLFPISPCFGICFCNQISLVEIFSCIFHYFVLFWVGFSGHFLYLNAVNSSGWVICGNGTLYLWVWNNLLSELQDLLASGQSQAYKHLVWSQPSEESKKCFYSLPLKSSSIFYFYAILKQFSGKLFK